MNSIATRWTSLVPHVESFALMATLDCGAGQPPPQPAAFGAVTEIWVPAGSGGQSAFYDVGVTLGVGGLLTE